MRIDWIRIPYATDFDMFQFCAEHLILLLLWMLHACTPYVSWKWGRIVALSANKLQQLIVSLIVV